MFIIHIFATLFCEKIIQLWKGSNMKKITQTHKVLLFVGFILMLLLLSNLFSSGLTVKASLDNPKNDTEDYEKALQTAPKGLHWDDGSGGKNNAFATADFRAAIEGRGQQYPSSDILNGHQHSLINNATIIPSPKGDNTSIIQMTNGKGQTGAVWSRNEASNYFDISHEQVASMWIYLGHVYSENAPQSEYPGDGMAFVLQNDENKENAISIFKNYPNNGRPSLNGYPVNGQSIGVWGADWTHAGQLSAQTIADSAIHNSWALEFDTFVNYSNSTSYGEGVSFDEDFPDDGSMRTSRHIAGNYPGSPLTYINKGDHFSMNHGSNYKIVNDLVNSKWRHITIKWTPKNVAQKTGTLSYAYNDKDPDTYLANNIGVVRDSFPIDGKNFGLKGDDTKLYWGFTASTGSNFENNLLIFESIPSFVDASATAKISNDSNGGQTVTENSTVQANDNIRYSYNLKYIGWDKTWADIKAGMGVPDNIHFTSGTISYPNSSTDSKPQPIPQKVFDDYDKDPSSKKLSYDLMQILDHTNNEANIELNGQAINKTSSTVTVPAIYSSFEGNNLITGAQTNSFKIKNRLFQLDSDSTNPIIAKKNEDVLVPGHVSYSGNSITPDYSSMVVHQILNGTNSITDTKVDDSGNFNLKINGNSLKDINQLSFYVTDKDNNQTNSVDRQIVVKGLLQFGFVQQDVFFKPINNPYVSGQTKPFSQPQIIRRAGDWAVNIVDNRDKGKNWVVRAKADPLKSSIDGSHFDGKIIFKDKNGNISDLSNTTDIASGSKTVDGTQISNITQPWTSDNGILLAMTGNNPDGKYTSQITWTIPDSIANS